MTKKRIATLATCIALVGTVAVGGTLALLSSNTATLTNTFTIGSGYPDQALTLDEDKVAQVTTGTTNFGGYEAIVGAGADRVAGQAYNNLVADTDLDKDPTFHLAANSPDSWIIAKVDGVGELKAKNITIKGDLPDDYGWFKLNMETGNITELATYEDLADGYYVTKAVVTAGTSTDDLFEELHVGANVVRGPLDNIDVKGVAVESVTDIWESDKDAVLALVNASDFVK